MPWRCRVSPFALLFPDAPPLVRRSAPHPPEPLPPLQGLLEVLRAVPYADNDVWLHTDASLMPRSRKTWASWNFLGRSGQEGDT